MKFTKSQIKTIILEEAAKVKKAISLKKQLQEVEKQLNEVMGGPHGGGKKTYKNAAGGFKENPGALVEKEVTEEVAPITEMGMGCEAPAQGGFQTEPGVNANGLGVAPEVAEETFDFTEQELEEMLNMEEEVVAEAPAQVAPSLPGAISEEEVVAEADKTSDPFVKDAPKQFNMSESVEVLRMRKLAGLL